MPDDSRNNSFIPKRGPARRSKNVASRQVYLFTLISYVMFFAALAAAGGVFLYDRYIDSQLSNSIESLNSAVAGFSEDEMKSVQAFNQRLKLTEKYLGQSISIADLLEYLEQATAESSSFSELSVQRKSSESLAVVASIETDSFESSIFQRETFESAGLANNVLLNEVVLSEGTGDNGGQTTVQFTATLDVPSSAVPYTVEEEAESPEQEETDMSEEGSVDTTGTTTENEEADTEEMDLEGVNNDEL